MASLWSDEIMAMPVRPARPVPVPTVPRERIALKPAKAKPAPHAVLLARRERDRLEAVAKAWNEGFRAAEEKYGLTRPPTSGEPHRRTLKEIATAVAEAHGFRLLDLQSNRRHRSLIICRQEAYWACRQETLYSLPQIGQFLNKDHTSVLHGIRRHEERLAGLAAARGAG